MLLGRNIPQFFDTNTENLRSTLLPKLENRRQPLRQMTPRPFRKEGVARMQFHARLVVGPVTADPSDPHVAGGDTLHGPILVVEDLGRGKSRENLDAQLFRLPRQPTAQITEA